MNNVDEVAAYKNENGSFDIIISLTQDGQPAKMTLINKHLSMEMNCGDSSVKLVFE